LGAFALQSDDARYGEWLASVSNIGPQLWQLLGGAMHKTLADLGIKPGARLLWMPPGSLGLLPMGLARDGANGRPLGDIYEMVSVPSLEALATASRQTAVSSPRSLATVVNPTGDLPFTETESTLIASRFLPAARTSLVRTAATPEAVLEALKGRTYWHFSSHGTFAWDDARKSALLMHGGERLSVGRLLESEATLGRPRLVVLSACETGLYDIDRNPEEFVGLPATFIQLGAAGVLSTLWQVDDMATALLVAKFYDLHLGQGQRPSAALRGAQAWLRNATRVDLIAFARSAGRRAGLDITRLAELESGLTTRHRSGTARFARAWELLQQDASETRSKKGRAADRAHSLQARPFAHPYYWGGFVYAGL
jgi:CHAT domain-containing protein